MRKLLFKWRLSRAIKKANKLHKKTGYKYLVLLVKGKPRVYSKMVLKHLIKIRYFQKGTTIQQLEKLAIYKSF